MKIYFSFTQPIAECFERSFIVLKGFLAIVGSGLKQIFFIFFFLNHSPASVKINQQLLTQIFTFDAKLSSYLPLDILSLQGWMTARIILSTFHEPRLAWTHPLQGFTQSGLTVLLLTCAAKEAGHSRLVVLFFC